jgi:hypothetical protein
MDATTDHRSREDAAFEPQGSGWMYRSEAFAEDVDHLLPAVLAAVAPRQAAAPAPNSARRRWPAMRVGAWFGRAPSAG